MQAQLNEIERLNKNASLLLRTGKSKNPHSDAQREKFINTIEPKSELLKDEELGFFCDMIQSAHILAQFNPIKAQELIDNASMVSIARAVKLQVAYHYQHPNDLKNYGR